jgi:hypothetical protein
MSSYGVYNNSNVRVAVVKFDINIEPFPYEATIHAPSGFKIGYTKEAYDSQVIDIFNNSNIWVGRGDIIRFFNGYFKRF